MPNDPQVIINTYILAHNALKSGIQAGTMTRQHELHLIDVLGQCFRDYVTNHQSAIAAEAVIQKAMHADKTQSN